MIPIFSYFLIKRHNEQLVPWQVNNKCHIIESMGNINDYDVIYNGIHYPNQGQGGNNKIV